MSGDDRIVHAAQLLERIHVVSGASADAALMRQLTTTQRASIVSFVNAHALNMAMEQDGFYRDLLASDVVLRDGIGVKMLMLVSGLMPGVNMNGTDFIPRVIKAFRGSRCAFYGTTEPWLSRAATLAGEAVEMVGVLDGFQDAQCYVQHFCETKPALVILAMGMPKQEAVATLLRAAAQHPCVIVNGGAILDFMSGRFPRAPSWMRRTGLEWLFRFLQEPRRMFSRYVTGGASSLSLLLLCAWHRVKK